MLTANVARIEMLHLGNGLLRRFEASREKHGLPSFHSGLRKCH